MFHKHVAVPVKKAAGRSCSALRETLKPICLRRTKALLDLDKPALVETIVLFSAVEQAQYKQILDMGRSAIDAAVSGHTGKTSRNAILKMILNLRIFCNHGTFMPLQDRVEKQLLDADEHRTLLEETEEAVCIVCESTITTINQVDDATSGVLASCSHMVCAACRDEIIDESAATPTYKCPRCDSATSFGPISDAGTFACEESSVHRSSKLDALIQGLLLSQRAEVLEKRYEILCTSDLLYVNSPHSIVFSAWRKTIAIAAKLCEQRGVRAVYIDGTTPHAERSKILDRFAEDLTISTLLMTIGTGGLG